MKLNKNVFNKWIYDIIDDHSNRIEVYKGGAGSGKSYGATQKILLKAIKYKRKVLVIRKFQNTIRHSIFTLILNHLRSLKIYGRCRIRHSDYEIELPNGSMFIFKGMDDEEKVKSIDGITDIVIEEATEISENEFTQLNLRLRADAPYLQIYLMFNPVSKKNWVYTYFFENAPPANCKIINTTYLDNSFLGKEYKQELENLRNRNPAYYRIYCLGEFATLDKLVFPNHTDRIITQEELKGLKLWVGLDFGYVNDPSALVWGFIDTKKRIIYVTGEYVQRGLMNDEIARVISDLGLKKEQIYADCAERKSIDEIKRYGIRIEPTEKGKDSVIHGIQWIHQYELVVDIRCIKVIEELENYTWKKDKHTNEYINEPVDTYNHTIDAIRYGLNKYIKGGKKPTVLCKPAGL